MASYQIHEEDLPFGYSLSRPGMEYPTLWDMMEEGYFPRWISLDMPIFGVTNSSLGWLDVDEGLHSIILSGSINFDDDVRKRILPGIGWPLERCRPLIMNFFMYLRNDALWVVTLERMFLTIASIICFGDQKPKRRRKLKSRVSTGKMIYNVAVKVYRKARKMGLGTNQVTGKNLIKDVCLLHFLDLQERLYRRGSLQDKRIWVWFDTAETVVLNKERRHKKKHLDFPFQSDVENLKRHPGKVDIQEHWNAFPGLVERLLDVSFTKDWPAITKL
ncbi:non-structural protein [Grand Arbaud virus]|uniref:Non-structural protein n=1 Tax=Grand Arbaud virus TaxID=487098 RepID=L7NZ68_9VIRU|nr:non-structural protein [Grand Arbaud virus]AFH08735.1 non-structural protein [Grand Arbaud virus]